MEKITLEITLEAETFTPELLRTMVRQATDNTRSVLLPENHTDLLHAMIEKKYWHIGLLEEEKK